MSKNDWKFPKKENQERFDKYSGIVESQEECLNNSTDWNRVRIEASISAMSALCNSCHDSVIKEIQEQTDMERSNVISYLAVRLADALIRELKK